MRNTLVSPSRFAVLALGFACACAHGSSSEPGPAPATGPVQPRACEPGDTALVRDVMYFGSSKPGGGTVSDLEWQRFLDEAVTPRFPAGLTIVEGIGQWRGASGAVEQERSRLVTLLHGGAESDADAITAIATEYKRRFQQEAVLRERSRICARFQ